MPRLARMLLAALLLAALVPSSAGAAVKFDVSTHFTHDVVVNTGDTGPSSNDPADNGSTSYGTAAAMAAAPTEQCRDGGQLGPLDIDGLPDDGQFAQTDVHPSADLDFGEGDNGFNVWKTNVNQANRTVDVPDQRYSRVHVFAVSSQGDSMMDVTLSYSDATSTSAENLTVRDWFEDPAAGAYALIDDMDRMHPTGTHCYDIDDGAIYGVAIDADPAKTLTSIDIKKDDASGTNFLLFGALGETTSLTVNTAGLGRGAVASDEQPTPYIDCDSDGGDCFKDWAPGEGEEVTLTATPEAGSVFAGWSGACTGTGQCVLTPDHERLVTARFGQVATLDVARAGAGSGRVESDPAGIDCGSDCSEDYVADDETEVELTALNAPGSVFAGWSGDQCSGTSRTCIVTMDEAASVTATFEPEPVDPGPDPTPGPGDDTSVPPAPPVVPLAPPAPLATDVLAPGLDVTLARRIRGSRLARSGLPLSFACSEACSLTAQVRLAGAVARRLRLSRGRAVTVGTATARGAAGQATTARIRLTRRAARRLRRAAATLSITLTATDAAGNATVVRRTVTVRR